PVLSSLRRPVSRLILSPYTTLFRSKIWNGGLGIWGAIAGGALGAWLACRYYKVSFVVVADSLAPGLLVAQGIGRWGNYFNQELLDRKSTRLNSSHVSISYAVFCLKK